MKSTSLHELALDLLGRARAAHSGRASHTVFGGTGHVLRQTAIALLVGQELAEHNSPSEATLYILDGRIRLTTRSGSIEGSTGELVTIPPDRHALVALEDSVVLLTVATR